MHMAITLKKKDPPKQNIWLAIPSYGGQAYIATYKSIIHDMFRLVMDGHTVRIFDEIGHADIYALRAQIVANFLADPNATDLVMIDSDVAWEPHGLQSLLAHDVDLVAAAYPKRRDPIEFMFRSAQDAGQPLMGDPGTGLVEVWGMPGGFMRCRRSMLEKMVAHYSDLFVVDRDAPKGKTCRLFDPYYFDTVEADGSKGKRVLSEDYAFCQRWRDMGGKVYLDASIGMAHIGTKAFTGKLGEFLPSAEVAA
jgi:hypothetical protein